jgi:hypothetical protein
LNVDDFLGTNQDGGSQAEMEEHNEVILTGLKEGMSDVSVSDIYLVALSTYESKAVLMGLQSANSLLAGETRLDIHVLKDKSLIF